MSKFTFLLLLPLLLLALSSLNLCRAITMYVRTGGHHDNLRRPTDVKIIGDHVESRSKVELERYDCDHFEQFYVTNNSLLFRVSSGGFVRRLRRRRSSFRWGHTPPRPPPQLSSCRLLVVLTDVKRNVRARLPLTVTLVPHSKWTRQTGRRDVPLQNSTVELLMSAAVHPQQRKAVGHSKFLKHIFTHPCNSDLFASFRPMLTCEQHSLAATTAPTTSPDETARSFTLRSHATPRLFFPRQFFTLTTHDIQATVRRKRSLTAEPPLRRKRYGSKQLKFEQERYTATVLENKAANTPVVTVKATDHLDAGADAAIVYSMQATMNRKSDEKFKLDQHTGEITTTELLDREDMASHDFNVYAQSGAHQTRCKVSIAIGDQNDNRPVFSQRQYEETIQENVRNGTYVVQVHADDADEGLNGVIAFSIISSVPKTSAFRIGNDGQIFVNGPVDREAEDKYELKICAKDRGLPPQSSTTVVTVNVEDVNDNSPTFTSKGYSADVSEDTPVNSVVIKVRAEDQDSDKNGRVRYSLSSGDPDRRFSIDLNTGEISLRSALDYERDHEGFVLKVRAQDSGRPSHNSISDPVLINVVDVNDNRPRFIGLPYNVSVLESQPVDSTVFTLQAVDDDYGENSRINYTILSSSSGRPLPFAVRRRYSGEITLSRALDYETARSYEFTVRATDSDPSEPKYADTLMSVNVLDVNDNNPTFENPLYTFRVPEDCRVNREVATVRASDRDSAANMKIKYAIASGNDGGVFNVVNRLNPVTRQNDGKIFLEKSLDYNLKKTYRLEITASDGERLGRCTVVINVSDRNSYPPVFEKNFYEAEVDEDVPLGTNVTVMHAADQDIGENARIAYCFVNSSCTSDNCCTSKQK